MPRGHLLETTQAMIDEITNLADTIERGSQYASFEALAILTADLNRACIELLDHLNKVAGETTDNDPTYGGPIR